MTIGRRIELFLRSHPEGVDDDTLTTVLSLKRRQQANSRCRQLEKDGLVARRRVRGKIHNFWTGAGVHSSGRNPPPQTNTLLRSRDDKPWYWEGNVQAAAARYLGAQHCLVLSLADTERRKPGKDIIAERNAKPVWITVKGYPEGTRKTRPSTQAAHWFKQAVFDVIHYRGESQTAEVGMALPDFPRYHSLARKIAWLQPAARFTYYWIRETGEVVES